MTADFIVRMQSEVEKLLKPESRLVSEWTGCWDNTDRIIDGDFSLCHCIVTASMSYKKFDDFSVSLHSHGCGNNTRQWKGKRTEGMEVWCYDPQADVDKCLLMFRDDLPELVRSFFGAKVWSKQDAVSELEKGEWKSSISCSVLKNHIEKEGKGAVFYVADFPKDLLTKHLSGWNYSPMMEIFFRRFIYDMKLFDKDKEQRICVDSLSPTRVCILLPIELEEDFCKFFNINKQTTL